MAITVHEPSDKEALRLLAEEDDRKRIQEVLRVHPRPWGAGEYHETECVVEDANGVEVCTISADWHADVLGIAETIVMAVNVFGVGDVST